MSELSDQIKLLANQYTGSTASLARQSGIDRSTLYKILSGQRVPTEEQLRNLLDVLHASPAQLRQLKALHAQLRENGTDRALQQALLNLLVTACQAPLSARRTAVLAQDLQLTKPEDAPAFQERGKELHQRILYELLHYLRSDDPRPLLLSPNLPATVRSVLLEAFALPQAVPKPVWQLLPFVRSSAPREDLLQNLAALSECLPFALLDSLRYEVRLCPVPLLSPPVGVPLPGYLLLPDTALLFDSDANGTICLQTAQVVEFFRLQYSREYRKYGIPLFSAEPARMEGSCFLLRRQPPFESLLYEGEAAPTLPHCYFTEEGVMDFLHTGQLESEPSAPPVPLALRQRALQRLRQACAVPGTILRLLDDPQLTPESGFSLVVRAGCHIQFLHRTADARPHINYLRDPEIAGALFTCLQDLRISRKVYSQTSTLEFLEYCREQFCVVHP